MSASTIVQTFLVLGLFFSSIGGLVVASILKKLDNVVKVIILHRKVNPLNFPIIWVIFSKEAFGYSPLIFFNEILFKN